MITQFFELYYAALAADARLSAVLISHYGTKRAAAMRYQPAEHQEVADAHAAKVLADAAWILQMEKLRAL